MLGKKINVEDLLEREPVEINTDDIFSQIKGKTILVTGGGGSIGSEICRQIAGHNPKRLVIFDIYENTTYELELELRESYPSLELTVLIGSVRDEKRVCEVFKEYRPEIVYHAAAHKHVPLMESSPNEAIKNNVLGTFNITKAAIDYQAEKFVLISTDKAINPTSIMGASKRICEMIVESMATVSKGCTNVGANATQLVAVRFGNVLGSNGSVIHHFQRQIEKGGPLTVTHPDVIRYFMTIPEAVSLVLQAGAYTKGGEIFVLDMGKPIKIDSLARKMISLYGLVPDDDVKIVYTGLRAGEKLYEENLLAEEGIMQTKNKLIYISKPTEFDTDNFFKKLNNLITKSLDNSEDIIPLIWDIIKC